MNFIEMAPNELLAFFYFYGNLCCAIIFFILFIKTLKNKQTRSRIFSNIVILLIIYFLGDALWALCYFNIIPYADTIIKFARMTYYIAAGIIGYFWLLYVEIIIGSPLAYSKKRKILYIPTIISTISTILICLFLNPAQKNIYGYLTAFCLILLPFGYIISAAIHMIYKRVHIQDEVIKTNYRKFALFPIVILAISLLQLFFAEIPIFCFGALALIIFLYIYNQDAFIFTDALTEINNRNMMNRYIKNINLSENEYYVFMIDIDKFKSINDTYGHLEGDKALKYMANVLKKLSSNHSYFLARYGGDEFIIFAKDVNKSEIDNTISTLNSLLSQSKDDLGYYIYASVGYSKIDPNVGIEKAIEAADLMLYKKKEIAHKTR